MEAPLELLAEVIKPDEGSPTPIRPTSVQSCGFFADLEAAGLMHESLISGRSEFRFKHTLTREAAGDAHPRRPSPKAACKDRTGDRSVVWTSRATSGLTVSPIHAYQARLSDKAIAYLSESCRRALERSAEPPRGQHL
jgi:hypothetical protein